MNRVTRAAEFAAGRSQANAPYPEFGFLSESRPPIAKTGPIQLWSLRTRPSVFGILSADSLIPYSGPPYKKLSAFRLPDTNCVPRHYCLENARYPGYCWFYGTWTYFAFLVETAMAMLASSSRGKHRLGGHTVWPSERAVWPSECRSCPTWLHYLCSHRFPMYSSPKCSAAQSPESISACFMVSPPRRKFSP